MLLESDPGLRARAFFDRERQVRKHIGDYTLFFAGMFPESIKSFPARRQRWKISSRGESRQGKLLHRLQVRALRVRQGRALFATLSKNFEGCVYGLNMVKERSGKRCSIPSFAAATI